MLLGEFVLLLLLLLIFLLKLKTEIQNSKIKADAGFGTVCKDGGYYSQGFFFFCEILFFLFNLKQTSWKNKGVYVTSKAKYAEKYCQENPKVFVIGFVIVGNPFPVIEHPFKAQKNYKGKPINVGYQSHFTLGIPLFLFIHHSNEQIFFITIKIVDGQDVYSAFPITKIEQLNENWIVDELVVHESQIYPSYIVYTR